MNYLSGGHIWPPTVEATHHHPFMKALIEVLSRLPEKVFCQVEGHVQFIFDTPEYGAVNVLFEKTYLGTNLRLRLDTIVVYHRSVSFGHEQLVNIIAHEIAHSVVQKEDHHDNEHAADEAIVSWGFEAEQMEPRPGSPKSRCSDFLQFVQYYVANIAIAGSTLRNQGAEGVVRTARSFVAHLDLTQLKRMPLSAYAGCLDTWTNELVHKFPAGAKNWGTARKAINVFMIQAFSNRFLSDAHDLSRLADVLETPLDSQAAKALHKCDGNRRLPEWRGLKALTPEASAAYQIYATELAAQEHLPRALLDLILWRQ